MPNRPVATSAHVDGSGTASTCAIAIPPLMSEAGPVPSQMCAPVLRVGPPAPFMSSMSVTVLGGKSVEAGNLQEAFDVKSTLQTPIWVAPVTVAALNATT